MRCIENQLIPFRNGKGKDDKSEGNCIYNVNHVDNICVKSWKNYGYSGNLSFIWSVDWYDKFFETLFRLPNSIFSPNAGLNSALSYFWKWKTNDSVDLLHHQFPKLWNLTLDSSSMLVYRQSTMACDDDIIGKVVEQNNFIKTFISNNTVRGSKGRNVLVELDKPTNGLFYFYYTDCVHHPGVQTQLHLKMFLNSIGC